MARVLDVPVEKLHVSDSDFSFLNTWKKNSPGEYSYESISESHAQRMWEREAEGSSMTRDVFHMSVLETPGFGDVRVIACRSVGKRGLVASRLVFDAGTNLLFCCCEPEYRGNRYVWANRGMDLEKFFSSGDMEYREMFGTATPEDQIKKTGVPGIVLELLDHMREELGRRRDEWPFHGDWIPVETQCSTYCAELAELWDSEL